MVRCRKRATRLFGRHHRGSAAGRVRGQRTGREHPAVAAGHAPGRRRLGHPRADAGAAPEGDAVQPWGSRARPQLPIVSPGHRGRRARAGRSPPVPPVAGPAPGSRTAEVPVLPPLRLPGPGRAIVLAGLLLSLLADRPAAGARLPGPDRVPGQGAGHRPRPCLVRQQPGTQRAAEHRAQPAKGPPQRPVGRARRVPDAERRPREPDEGGESPWARQLFRSPA
jgi:hypothetical protein